LLESRQRTQVDGSQPTHGHGANAVKERVDIGYLVAPIARIEDAGENKWCEGAVIYNEMNMTSSKSKTQIKYVILAAHPQK
jgi:hypothetical protein